MNTSKLIRPLAISFLLLFISGCSTVQYAALEKVGVHKRDILVDRVKDAREAQHEAKEKVTSTYEQFASLVNVEGGDLEKVYKKMDKSLKKTEDSVEEVDDRITAIEDVATDLFNEWKAENKEYTSQTLRKSSEKKLSATKVRYNKMLKSMKTARSRITPVLEVFQDRVLFLKHNLNARALSSLKGEVGSIETKVDKLIKEMERAIAEADQFIKTME